MTWILKWSYQVTILVKLLPIIDDDSEVFSLSWWNMINKINTQWQKAIAEELGQRLKTAHLNKNITQEQVAESAWVSRRTVAKAEEDYVLLENLIAILQALDMLGQINHFYHRNIIHRCKC